MVKFLGFEITRSKDLEERPSFTPKQFDDGAVIVGEGGAYGMYLDMDGTVRTEAELVGKYREIAEHPEVDMAIDEILNEAVVNEPESDIVSLNVDDIKFSDSIKKKIQAEFENVLDILEFNDLAYEIFKRWYVDGRIYYHVILDNDKPEEGIKELRWVDPRKIRKIRQIQKGKDARTGTVLQKTANEFFLYNDKGFAQTKGAIGASAAGSASAAAEGIRIAKDSVIHVTSGLVSPNNDAVRSYLHKSIKAVNQLRALEDSLVIYRISRAPERRVFYIDVGNLPKVKAEQYLRDVMTKFKNKVVYDSSTGQIRDDRKFMTMLEDYWLPRREGGRGTEITTLPGGQNLDQIEDINYFQRNLYKTLNVPVTRMEPDNMYTMGRATEVSRDEVKFSKFITRLRKKFSVLFTKLLEKQLILKNIVSIEDWQKISQQLEYQYATDNYFSELKENEIWKDRIGMLRDLEDFVGVYFSKQQIRTQILKQTEEEIDEIDKQIEEEEKDGEGSPNQVVPDQGPPE